MNNRTALNKDLYNFISNDSTLKQGSYDFMNNNATLNQGSLIFTSSVQFNQTTSTVSIDFNQAHTILE